jgi:hypothetical protein
MTKTASERPGGRQPVYARSPDVEARRVGDDTFLSSGPNGTIHRLDPIASAFWSALDEPRSLGVIVELFMTAFPDAPRPRLEGDLAGLAADLEERGLITAARD